MKQLICAVLILWQNLAFAETPQILNNAFDAYQKNGYAAFLPALAKGSAVEKEKSLTALTAGFPTIEAYFGKLEGLEVLREVQISSKIKNTYFTLNYEKGPLYGVITTYKSSKGELLTHVALNGMGSVILPSSMIEGEK